jgi:carbonic anhydrase/acetyltransferase-like protein (isoleucine patch superfamily)
VVFEGDTGFLGIEGNSTLTLAPGAVVRGRTGRIGQAVFVGGTSVLVNQGLIRAEVAGGALTIVPNSMTHSGVMETANGGVIAVNAAGWTQGGTLRMGPGTIQLGGNLALAAGGSRVGNGGVLALTGTLDLAGGTLALDTATGGLVFSSGVLRNGTVQQAGSGRLTFGSSGQNVLDGVTVVGDLDLTAASARVRVRNGLTLNGGLVRLNNNGAIGFEGSQTFTGEVVFEGDTGFLGIEGNSTLTLAPGAVVRGRTGRIGQAIFVGGTSVLVNQGLIRADVAGGTLTIMPNSMTHSGVMETANGGVIAANAGAWTQGGTLRVGPGTIQLGGTVTLGAGGSRVGDGGNLDLTGTLDLGGGTLALDTATGGLRLNGGTLRNGTVSQAGTGRLRVTSTSQNILDGVTVVGDLDLTEASSRVRARNGLTLNGGLVRLNNNSAIGFEGSQTFAGEVVFEGDTGFLGIEGNSTLTLAPGAVVRGRTGRIGQAVFVGGTSVLVNQGLIRAEVAGGTLTIVPNSMTHSGVMETANGGVIAANATAWTQGGTLRMGPGTIQLGGTVTLGAGGSRVGEGGNLDLTGALDLGGGTLALDTATGGLRLNGGTLRNGTVSQAGTGRLRVTSTSQNILDGVTVVGDLDLTEASSRVRARNGLTVNAGRVRLNNNGAIGFEGSQSFGGEVLFEGDSGFLSVDGNSTLTLGPTALVHGRTGRIGQAVFVGGTSVLVNQGIIRASVAGGTLTVNPTTFTNTGTLEQINGGRLVAPGFP